MKKSKRRRRAPVSLRDTERMWQGFLRQPPQLTTEQAETMEKNFALQIGNSGLIRRAALASLTRSGRQLQQNFGSKADRSSAEAAASLVSSVRSMREFLLAVVDCLETAATRLEVVLYTREDRREIMSDSNKPSSVAPATTH